MSRIVHILHRKRPKPKRHAAPLISRIVGRVPRLELPEPREGELVWWELMRRVREDGA